MPSFQKSWTGRSWRFRSFNEMEETERKEPEKPLDVIIDLNLEFPGGRERAREQVGDVAGREVAHAIAEGVKCGQQEAARPGADA